MDQEIDTIVQQLHDMWKDTYREVWKTKSRQPYALQPGLYFIEEENEKKRKAEKQNEEDRKRFKADKKRFAETLRKEDQKRIKADADSTTLSVCL